MPARLMLQTFKNLMRYRLRRYPHLRYWVKTIQKRWKDRNRAERYRQESLICLEPDGDWNRSFVKDVVYTAEELERPREDPFGTTNGDLKRGLEFGKKEYLAIDQYCKDKIIQKPLSIPLPYRRRPEHLKCQNSSLEKTA